ncbi:MAG TPA: hypothetical protein VNM92_06510 [Thermoanaerobaculia bacterium]|nr:hypothetical protein [Thermoanaerobaculia bacterium]
MKTALVCILLLATPSLSSAAIQYEFRQTSRSDQGMQPPVEVTGRAVLEGERSRVEYLQNPVYGQGTYVLSLLSARSIYIINPRTRTYYDVPLSTVANSLGSAKIEVTNLKAGTKKMDDHPLIAGVPTDHYRFESSYDMTVMFGSIPLRQAVVTTVDSWTTNAFGSVPAPIFASTDFTTGNAELDKLISAETSRVSGLALRQIVTITTSAKKTGVARKDVKLNVSKRQTSEILVSAVRNVQVEPSFFQIPEGFTKSVPKREGIDGQLVDQPSSTPGTR